MIYIYIYISELLACKVLRLKRKDTTNTNKSNNNFLKKTKIDFWYSMNCNFDSNHTDMDERAEAFRFRL